MHLAGLSANSGIILLELRGEKGGRPRQEKQNVLDLLEGTATCLSLGERALGIEHTANKRADHSSFTHQDELIALHRDERDVLARSHADSYR